ncbi:kelch repeat-containing protein [Motiliproteus sp. SC1-56]|uniref:kelch repeat-containing protein n=1 Tax=Motiliproteus sp. SC1-56 TaxID=2799565 RepID=UPI001A902144|nr:kelch repeat-containing protein [Motiliproteus sp. SC1-56]
MSEPIWVPSRRQILHWGAVNRAGGGGGFTDESPLRNDVVSFNVKSGTWESDYPSDNSPQVSFSIRGVGEILPSGNPAPGNIVNGVAWNSKQQRLVYAMPGLTAAYDPATRRWTTLAARSEVPSHQGGEAPRAYGSGIAYDPINDELVMFPHWGLLDQTMIGVTGEVSGHAGTLAYRFADGTWRSLRRELGTDSQRGQREAVKRILARVSAGLDLAHALHAGAEVTVASVMCAFDAAADAADKLAEQQPKLADLLEEASANLRAAAKAVSSDENSSEHPFGRNALWALYALLDDRLRIEPPPRSAADMEWHPEKKVIVMYGGIGSLVRTDLSENSAQTPGALSDTWLYDPQTRSWREIAIRRQPPPQARSHLSYDPQSRMMLLVTRSIQQGTIGIWALDLETESWSLLQQEKWAFEWNDSLRNVTGHAPFEVAFDPENRLFMLTQGTDTFVMKLNLAGMHPEQPEPTLSEPPIKPLEVPKENPSWLAELAELPTNTWHAAHPEGGEPAFRQWGNLAYDQVRGWVFYFGGGHASYQVNNVSIYSVGANRWVTGPGEHNDHIPPINWGGRPMSFRGGPPAAHQRNTYTAVDGRMYRANGGTRYYSRKKQNKSALADVPRHNWFYDVDRGGLWRQQRVSVKRHDRVKGVYGGAQLSDPRGRVLGFQTNRGRYYGKRARKMWLGIHDIYSNSLEVREIPPPYPPLTRESVPFTYMSDRDQVFFYTHPGKKNGADTWIYDISENRFSNLKTTGSPSGQPAVVVYLEGQNAVFAASQSPKEEWLFSLQHLEWKKLPTASKAVRIQEPYGQMVYASRYGVLINVRKRTSVMRIDATEFWPDLKVNPPGKVWKPLTPPRRGQVCAAIQLPSLK